MWKKSIGLIMAVCVMASISCNRGSGCPANEHMAQMGAMSPGEIMQMKQKKKKNAGPKSSVLPAEVKYKGKRKSKKGCPAN